MFKIKYSSIKVVGVAFPEILPSLLDRSWEGSFGLDAHMSHAFVRHDGVFEIDGLGDHHPVEGAGIFLFMLGNVGGGDRGGLTGEVIGRGAGRVELPDRGVWVGGDRGVGGYCSRCWGWHMDGDGIEPVGVIGDSGGWRGWFVDKEFFDCFPVDVDIGEGVSGGVVRRHWWLLMVVVCGVVIAIVTSVFLHPFLGCFICIGALRWA